jgi:hypothetical protein
MLQQADTSSRYSNKEQAAELEMELESNSDMDQTKHKQVVKSDQKCPGTGTGLHRNH